MPRSGRAACGTNSCGWPVSEYAKRGDHSNFAQVCRGSRACPSILRLSAFGFEERYIPGFLRGAIYPGVKYDRDSSIGVIISSFALFSTPNISKTRLTAASNTRLDGGRRQASVGDDQARMECISISREAALLASARLPGNSSSKHFGWLIGQGCCETKTDRSPRARDHTRPSSVARESSSSIEVQCFRPGRGEALNKDLDLFVGDDGLAGLPSEYTYRRGERPQSRHTRLSSTAPRRDAFQQGTSVRCFVCSWR